MKKHKLADRFLKELEKGPIVELACNKVGISRQTAYRWRSEDSEFKKKMDDILFLGRGMINDLGESQLINLIKGGDFKAIRFWMAHNSERYAAPKWRMDQMTGAEQGGGLAEMLKAALERRKQRLNQGLNS